MKRNINLLELSRDHHYGLLLGWKIRQGIKYDISPEVIAEYIAYFSVAALFPHFREEETQILPYLPDDDNFKIQTLKEHEEIARLIGSLSTLPVQADVILNIAKLVDDHIRFEERELFPYLENELDPDQLEKIGAAICESHQPFVEDYPLEFWKTTVIK
jgi:hypothetical protein